MSEVNTTPVATPVDEMKVVEYTISPAANEMLLKLWAKYTNINTEAQKHLEVFKEFEQYLRADLKVPAGFLLTPDGKSFVEPPKQAVN